MGRVRKLRGLGNILGFFKLDLKVNVFYGEYQYQNSFCVSQPYQMTFELLLKIVVCFNVLLKL